MRREDFPATEVLRLDPKPGDTVLLGLSPGAVIQEGDGEHVLARQLSDMAGCHVYVQVRPGSFSAQIVAPSDLPKDAVGP